MAFDFSLGHKTRLELLTGLRLVTTRIENSRVLVELLGVESALIPLSIEST